LIALPIDVRSGERIEVRSRGAFSEYFRLDGTGRFTETQYRLVSRSEDYTVGGGLDVNSGGIPRPPWFAPFNDGAPGNSGFRRDYDGTPLSDQPRRYDPRSFSLRPPRGAIQEPDEPPPTFERRIRPRRADPGYYWGSRPGY
jgi:hypothetical protein